MGAIENHHQHFISAETKINVQGNKRVIKICFVGNPKAVFSQLAMHR